jgi:hypothetical protein
MRLVGSPVGKKIGTMKLNFDINKDCEKIYDGVLLQSYISVVANVIIFNVVKLIVEYLIITPILNCCLPKSSDIEHTGDIENPIGEKSLQVERNDSDPKSKKKVPKSVIIFLYFQALCALFSLIVACVTDYPGNFWLKYEYFYGFLLNSPYFTYFVLLQIS